MILNYINNAMFSNIPINKIFLGTTLIWQRKELKYIELFPKIIWLVENNTEIVNVVSNTTWKVK